VLFLTVPDGLAELIGGSADKRELFGAAANGFGQHSPLAHLIASNNINSQAQFSLSAALIVEVVAAGVLVAAYLVMTRPGVNGEAATGASRAPLAVGGALTVLMLVTLPITNGGLNPARSTAAAILAPSWALSQLWLFWVAPLLGAALVALLVRAFGSAAAADAVDDEDDVDDDEGDEESLPVLPS
jgi:aquaporin Z